jgi:hypothetical protein
LSVRLAGNGSQQHHHACCLGLLGLLFPLLSRLALLVCVPLPAAAGELAPLLRVRCTTCDMG